MSLPKVVFVLPVLLDFSPVSVRSYGLRLPLAVVARPGLVELAAAAALGVALTPEEVEEAARAILDRLTGYYLSVGHTVTRIVHRK